MISAVVLASGVQLVGLSLLTTWALLLLGGFALGRPHSNGTRRMPTWTRIGSSLALVVLAWTGLWLAPDPGARPIAGLIGLGMTLGLLGDLCMAHLIPLKNRVLGGIGAFALGHLAYIAAFLRWANQHAVRLNTAQLAAWIGWLGLGLLGWYWIVWRPAARPSGLHWAALPYTLLLSSTAGIATGLALAVPSLIWLALGASLFLLSDLLLATQLFNHASFPLISDLVWLSYGPGQMLIVCSMLLHL